MKKIPVYLFTFFIMCVIMIIVISGNMIVTSILIVIGELIIISALFDE